MFLFVSIDHVQPNRAGRIVDRFSELSISEEMNGNGVHCTSNILTLRINLFDDFNLWFEAVPMSAPSAHARPAVIIITYFLPWIMYCRTCRILTIYALPFPLCSTNVV